MFGSKREYFFLAYKVLFLEFLILFFEQKKLTIEMA